MPAAPAPPAAVGAPAPPTAVPAVPAAQQARYQQWVAWSATQHFGGSHPAQDTANPAQPNRLDWYTVTNWSKPYPGDPTIFAPAEVPGADRPNGRSADVSGSVSTRGVQGTPGALARRVLPVHPSLFVVFARAAGPGLVLAKSSLVGHGGVGRCSSPWGVLVRCLR